MGSNSISEHSSYIWHFLNPLILCEPNVAQPLNLVNIFRLYFADTNHQSFDPVCAQRGSDIKYGLVNIFRLYFANTIITNKVFETSTRILPLLRAATPWLDSMICLDEFWKPILGKWLSVTWFRSGHILANIWNRQFKMDVFNSPSHKVEREKVWNSLPGKRPRQL